MPILHARPCWSRFLEFDTSIAGATWWMLSMAMTDLLDVLVNLLLMSDLEARCRANLNGLRAGTLGSISESAIVPPWTYTDEPVDKWSAFAVNADRFPGQSIVADCDDLVGPWGAFWKSRSAVWKTEKDGARAFDRWMSQEERRAARVPLAVGVAISQPKVRPCCPSGRCAERSRRLCGHGMAHTYDVLLMPSGFEPSCDFGGALVRAPSIRGANDVGTDGDLWVWDGSVAAGMRRPSQNFYGSGETSLLWMPDAKLSHLEV